MKVKSEDYAKYIAIDDRVSDDALIRSAIAVLKKRMIAPDSYITSPEDVSKLCILELAEEESEMFCCIFLDNRHGVIKFEKVFQGTIDGASIHPREVARRCLKHNAAAVIFTHNHPSGNPEPSSADEMITKRLKDSLSLLDIRVLDHIIVGGVTTTSFANRGLM